MHYVIGSGPAGVACAQALVDAGRPVTVLDAGLTLESRAGAATAPVDASAAPRKLTHGSDYPYRLAPSATPVVRENCGLEGSYALGGFSNLWGGAVLPYRQADIADWPIGARDLATAYARVARIMPIAAAADALETQFPLASDRMTPLRRSRQSEHLLAQLKARKTQLNAQGVHFGGARLAVASRDDAGAEACVYCGRCLHGCPRDIVYSSRQTLESLRVKGALAYEPGVVVRRIEEQNGAARIHALAFDGAPRVYEGARAFVAAGAVNSTEIALRSVESLQGRAEIKDSQYFLLPMLRLEGFAGVAEESLHTLAQLFLEFIDEGSGAPGVHLQVYSYSDHLAAELDHKLGPLRRLFPKNALLSRLLLVQGYLHSSCSGAIDVRLERGAFGEKLRLTGQQNPQSRRAVGAVVRRLMRLAPHTRTLPLAPLLRVTEPGRGFHCGGALPMAANPTPRQTDTLGRPFGFERLHLVDSTVFPSIPTTTITYSVMANAYRIGSAIASSDRENGR